MQLYKDSGLEDEGEGGDEGEGQTGEEANEEREEGGSLITATTRGFGIRRERADDSMPSSADNEEEGRYRRWCCWVWFLRGGIIS